MKYLHENKINAYIPDNQFRSRDPKFTNQKIKHGKRHQQNKKSGNTMIAAGEFDFYPVNKTCTCPAGETMWLRSDCVDKLGHHKLFIRTG